MIFIFGSNFYSLIFRNSSNSLNFGRIDLKIMQNYVIFHVFVFNLFCETKYDMYIILGEKGNIGCQKAFITTNNCGCLDDTFRITTKNSKFPIENYKKISCIALINNKTNDVVAFNGDEFEYKDIIFNKKEKQIYCVNEKFEGIINSGKKHWPFTKQNDSINLIKISPNTFTKLKLNMKDNLRRFIENNNKIYGYLIFGSLKKGSKILYILGIPDKYDFNQAIAMANMGIYRFLTLDFKRNAQQGDLGFWMFFE
ncbi:MAG: hypothetical protein CfP315_0394 [Candidatus Improbicoccus pseudotrichonymphae]|uniref:Uncharacterized protein n=1 Tax=Candidatus Improbicoccus pseudotrichonymphae TaxID=3033792 RepID=A0AA48KZ22_9FIRM|nr:MAG: hypothetical protein CfP315_0394 [Candidatus Improbicoccus pseudotrichonymphae]